MRRRNRLHATAGEQHRVALRPVIAAGLGVDLGRAENSPIHSTSVVSSRRVIQIVQRRQQRLVGDRQVVFLDDRVCACC